VKPGTIEVLDLGRRVFVSFARAVARLSVVSARPDSADIDDARRRLARLLAIGMLVLSVSGCAAIRDWLAPRAGTRA
jgi:hypothetical protein